MEKTTRFGIEIEMTGISRGDAAKAAQTVLGGELLYGGSYYDTYELKTFDGRTWKFTYDGSIRCETKTRGIKQSASRLYSVELVSPILTYGADIESLQEVVRALRKAGAFTNSSCGIHIHLRQDREHLVRRLPGKPGRTLPRKPLPFFEPALLLPRPQDRRAARLQQHAPCWGGQKLHRVCPSIEHPGAHAKLGEHQEAPSREREVRDAHLPQSHRLHRRRVQSVSRASDQAPDRISRLAKESCRLKGRRIYKLRAGRPPLGW